jgi:hypothetical protein
MAKQMSEEEIYELAQKRIKAKRDFYNHLAVYVIVNVLLVIIWAFPAGRGYPWFLWVIGGWGIGVLTQFLKVFVFKEEIADSRAVEKEADKIRRDQG